ncbi:MAG: 4-phosphopantoate--beta-alanine ligase [Candidatus Helarchaeales archaeon]
MPELGEEHLPNEIPEDHPRAASLRTRHLIIDGLKKNIVTEAGLIAHGRGEAFDYLIGEKTPAFALKAIDAACIAMLLAEHPVISVNGNVAALVPNEIVRLSQILNAKLEVNLFYRKRIRELAIERVLKEAGATEILGVHSQTEIPHLSSKRRIVDPEGIAKADVVLVPLEDGDRTEALKKSRKKVIAIDLNPLSRTARHADITIVDNLIRCVPLMIIRAEELKKKPEPILKKTLTEFNNQENLMKAIDFIRSYLGLLTREKERDSKG